MEFRVLKYFLTVAQEESITNAAKLLHITQPTLSRQINELEAELQTSLFIRTNRNTLLTSDGLLFKQRAQDILALMEKTEQEFQHSPNDIHGTINIGSVETGAMQLIIQTIDSLHRLYPKIKYNFYNGNTIELLERLDNGVLDFCMVFETINKEKYNDLPVPIKDTTGILTHKNSPYAHLTGITLDELKDMPLLISSRFSRGSFPLKNQSAESALDIKKLNILGTYHQIYNAILMVKSGICNAISIGSPLTSIADNDLVFIPFSPNVCTAPSILWKKQPLTTHVNQLFIDALYEKMNQQ